MRYIINIFFVVIGLMQFQLDTMASPTLINKCNNQPIEGIEEVVQGFINMDFKGLDSFFIAPLWLEIADLQSSMHSKVSELDLEGLIPKVNIQAGKNNIGKIASIIYVLDSKEVLSILITYTEDSNTCLVRTIQINEGDRLIDRYPKFYDLLKPKIEAIDNFTNTTPVNEIIDIYKDAILYMEENRLKAQFYFKDLNEILSSYYGGLAWYYVLASQGVDAVIAAQQGLTYYDKVWINANLAHGYLLTGQFEEAKKIYLTYKDVSYNGQLMKYMYLQDFQDMKAAGIRLNTIDEIAEMIK